MIALVVRIVRSRRIASLSALVKQIVSRVRKMDTAGPQQSLHLLGRFFNHLARIVDLNHQLNESLISAVETPRQDYRNIEEHC